jgi:hypothetical protein
MTYHKIVLLWQQILATKRQRKHSVLRVHKKGTSLQQANSHLAGLFGVPESPERVKKGAISC